MGLGVTLIGETLAYLGVYSLPRGVTVSGASLILAVLAYLAVSRLTRREDVIDPDVRLVMEL